MEFHFFRTLCPTGFEKLFATLEHSLFLRETTPDEIAKVLKNFDTKKASHLYGTSPKFVKISADVIKTKLSLILNESF